jgi:hypothetical protein
MSRLGRKAAWQRRNQRDDRGAGPVICALLPAPAFTISAPLRAAVAIADGAMARKAKP